MARGPAVEGAAAWSAGIGEDGEAHLRLNKITPEVFITFALLVGRVIGFQAGEIAERKGLVVRWRRGDVGRRGQAPERRALLVNFKEGDAEIGGDLAKQRVGNGAGLGGGED